MAPFEQTVRLRFEGFEIDLRTRELRKEGRVVKLQDQPLRLLTLLAKQAGKLVTRAEIEKELWGEDTVVEFEHSINTAMRKIREALEDDLERPRFVETLPRKGYRFVAPVESVGAAGEILGSQSEARSPAGSLRDKIPLRGQPIENAAPELALDPQSPPKSEPKSVSNRVPVAPSAASPEVSPAGSAVEPIEEFALPRGRARYLFLLIQSGFLAMYCAALYKAEAIEGVLARFFPVSASVAPPIILVSSMCGIAVRLYLLAAVGLDHPAAGIRFRRLFPMLFVLDALWSASPLLLASKIGYGLALGSVAALAYLPFAQRTLMLSAYRSRKSLREAAAKGASLPALGGFGNASPDDDRTGG